MISSLTNMAENPYPEDSGDWVALKNLKETYSVTLAEYSVGNGP